jgi:transcriptional regulator with XRE-family HTH domain
MGNRMPDKDWEAFRSYLKELLRHAAVRQAVEQRTDISARTLARWVSGETEEPDRKRLASLLRALPQYREPLLSTISKALPDFAALLLDQTKSLVEDLPVDFWVRLVEINATTPKNLHFTTIVHLLFLQLQATTDAEHLGLQLLVACCSPPASPAHPVRSLRTIVQLKTHASLPQSPEDPVFMGAESLGGYSVETCRAHIVQDVQEEQRLPVLRFLDRRSAAAYPIQRGGAVAGAFVVSSPQPGFFTQRLHDLLHIYAYLLSLAFETNQFYPSERIHLHLMPPASMQRPYITHFQMRVLELLQSDLSLSRSQADQIVWQQIEEALLWQAAT